MGGVREGTREGREEGFKFRVTSVHVQLSYNMEMESRLHLPLWSYTLDFPKSPTSPVLSKLQSGVLSNLPPLSPFHCFSSPHPLSSSLPQLWP